MVGGAKTTKNTTSSTYVDSFELPPRSRGLFPSTCSSSPQTRIFYTPSDQKNSWSCCCHRKLYNINCESRDPHTGKKSHPSSGANKTSYTRPLNRKINNNVTKTQAFALATTSGGKKEERKHVRIGNGCILVFILHSKLFRLGYTFLACHSNILVEGPLSIFKFQLFD